MKMEVETKRGRCATHGTVEATREIPRMQFPYVVFATRRYMARRRPLRCPTCGADLTAG